LTAKESRYEIICDAGLHDGFCDGFDHEPLSSDFPPVPARVVTELQSAKVRFKAQWDQWDRAVDVMHQVADLEIGARRFIA